MRRTETPKSIWIKFCTVVDIPDLVTYTNFRDHRLRGFWVAGGQISPSPIDFHRRPYNTLALPYEHVICLSVRYFVGAAGHSFVAIFTISGSNDVILQPLVPFGGHINIAPN